MFPIADHYSFEYKLLLTNLLVKNLKIEIIEQVVIDLKIKFRLNTSGYARFNIKKNNANNYSGN